MHFVDQPLSGHCVATARHEDPEGFIELGNGEYGDPVYLAGQGVRDAAHLLGHFTKEEHEALQTELDETKAHLATALNDLADAERIVAAVDILESADFTRRRKPGAKKAAA